MRIEQKAKLYDEARTQAEQYWESGDITREQLEHMFSELAESKEDKIRRVLIEYFTELTMSKDRYIDPDCEVSFNDIIEFLKASKSNDTGWTKEDEHTSGEIRSIIEECAFSNSAVDVNGELCEKRYVDADNWVKSLKDRILPQLIQKWSEKDERNLQGIIDEIKANKNQAPDYDIETYDRFLNWLKSLRPQNIWKPTKEQLDYLARAVIRLGNEGDCKTANILGDLRLQLKAFYNI